MNDYEDVIAAFLDDERVDAASLQDALALPEGREYLVQLLALREVVSGQGEAVRAVTSIAANVRTIRRWVAAAAVLLAASAGGYFAGARSAAHAQGRGASVEVVLEAATPAAPKPTQLIRLEPGVNWSAAGGR